MTGSEYWTDKVKIAVLQTRKVFEQWLQQRSEQTFHRHREEKRREKAAVKEAKRDSEYWFGTKLSQIFKRNRKTFWKEVKRMRKGVQGEEMRFKDRDGNMLVEGKAVRQR